MRVDWCDKYLKITNKKYCDQCVIDEKSGFSNALGCRHFNIKSIEIKDDEVK